MTLFWYIIVFLALGPISVFAQSEKIIVKYTGQFVSDENITDGGQIFIRDAAKQVHFIHKGADVWCDKAVYYEDQDFIEAYSNSNSVVSMQQGDSINMTANYVEYSGISQLAFASGNVVLTEPKSTLTTDTLYFDRVRQQGYYNSNGKVVRDSVNIISKIGRYYTKSNKYQFIDDVVLVHPNYTLATNRLDYFTDNGHAYLFGPSTITGKKSKVYCERGFYNTNNDTGYFEKNAKIDYESRSFKGDSLYFDRKRSFASATNNITITDTINNSIVKGHYAEVWHAKDSIFITKRALAITLQEKDSIYIHADTLMMTGNPEHRITRAFYDVRLYKSDLAGKADSIHVDHKTGLTQLINLERFSSSDVFTTKRKPILWNLNNQMTGDTIHLISNVITEKLDSLKVFNNAFLISRDSLGTGFNQIKGKQLTGLFKDNTLHNANINKNAEVIYYSRNNDNELVGINKSKSASISIKINNGEIEEIQKIKQVDGELYPESMFPKSGKRLRGFDWRGEERPLSKADLFKNRSFSALPTIKGLDDYIPPKDYVDDNVKARLEKAEKRTTENKGNKAKRNIPNSKKILNTIQTKN